MALVLPGLFGGSRKNAARPGRGSRPPSERTVPTAAPRSRQDVPYCGVVNMFAQACAMARSGDVRPGNVAQPPF
jgi:hypothetical protein